MNTTWEQLVNNMFSSKNASELQIRAFCTYSILKDCIYTDVLPGVLEILKEAEIDVKSEVRPIVWGKLTSAAIFLMTQKVLRHYIHERDNADNFNLLVFNSFLRDFNEQKETLTEYERNNSALGNGQPVWAMGNQICKVVGHKDASLALKICVFWKQIAEITNETTKDALGSSLNELKEKMLRLVI